MSDTGETLRFGICDNEASDLILIENALLEIAGRLPFFRNLEIDSFQNGKALLDACKENAFHLVFLDIEMPDQSGFELAKRLQLLHQNTRIVFVSSHEGCVYDSFDYIPLRFVRKNHLERDMERALQKYLQLTRVHQLSYKISTGYGRKEICLTDILYFECNAHDITVVTGKDRFHTYGSLKTVEKELEHADFIRVHRNYLLNKAYIGHVGIREIELLDGSRISMGRGRKKIVEEALKTYDRRLY